jgi:hypothetical protein
LVWAAESGPGREIAGILYPFQVPHLIFEE